MDTNPTTFYGQKDSETTLTTVQTEPRDDTLSSSISSADIELSKILEDKGIFTAQHQLDANSQIEDGRGGNYQLYQQKGIEIDEDILSTSSHMGIAMERGNDKYPSHAMPDNQLNDANQLMLYSNEPRRRSTRDIKRPKFDDEIVESIQMAQQKYTPKRRQSQEKNEDQPRQGQGTQKKGVKNATDSSIYETFKVPGDEVLSNVAVAKHSRKRKLTNNDGIDTSMMTNLAKIKRPQNHASIESGDYSDSPIKDMFKAANPFVETMKIWSPEDDIALIAAVTHVSDLWVVYSQMRFSKRYTLDQIEERWYELMYNEQVSKLARKRMEQISKEQINSIQMRVPFSMQEEQLICQIPSDVLQPFHHIEKLFEQNRDTFHHARDVKILEEHWRELKSLYLLVDQQTPPAHLCDEDNLIEQTYDLYSLAGPHSEQLPLDVEERQFTRNTIIAEREANEWEGVVVKTITGITPNNPTMTSETIGMICGRCTTFDIRKEKILIGRSTKRHNVDVNLTLEGPTGRISRKQAILKMVESGDCLLRNIGKKHIVVGGQVLMEGDAAKLSNNAMIEISSIKLKFQKNENYRSRLTEDNDKRDPTKR